MKKEMKKLLALCMVFVMVLGMLGASVPVAASNNPTATVKQLDSPMSTDGIRMYLASEVTLPDGHLKGNIKVNGTVDSTLYLYWVFSGYYVIWYANPIQDTTIEFGGTYTTQEGSSVELANTILKYNGTQWIIVEDTKHVTVNEVVDKTVTDGNIRLSVTTEDTLPVNMSVYGDISVNNSVRTNTRLLKYSASNYAILLDSTDIAALTSGTIVRLGGIYTSPDGRNVEFGESIFIYDGVEWEKATTTAITVKRLDSPTATDGIRMYLQSEDKLPDGTLSGTIKVNDQVDSTLNFAFQFKDEISCHSYYVVWYKNPIKDTTIEFDGYYVSTTGAVFKFVNTVLKYNGTQWIIEEDIKYAIVTDVIEKSVEDGNIRLSVTTNDTLPVGMSVYGDVYVNNSVRSNTQLLKYEASKYAVFLNSNDITALEAGVIVKIGGIYISPDGRKVEFAEIIFEYTGTSWEVQLPAKVMVNKVVDTSIDTDKHIRMSVTTEDKLADNTTVTGKIYVDGKIQDGSVLAKYAASNYVVYMNDVTVTEGTKVKIGGIYTAADGRQVELKDITFIYNGSYWEFYIQATVSAVCIQEDGDKHIRMIVKSNDTLPDDTLLTGNVYVNDTLNTSLELKKVSSAHYTLFTDNVNITEGTKVKLGGFYISTQGLRVDFTEVTFVYNGTDWKTDGVDGNATVREVVDTTAEDKHIRLSVTTDDTITIGTSLIGTIYVDGIVNSDVVFLKTGAETYTIQMDKVSVEEGTKVKIGGTYRGDGKNVTFEEVVFVYKGTEWQLLRTVYVGNAKDGVIGIDVADGDTLPMGYIEDKYIIGWNVNTYTNTTTDYVADYIDLDILNIHLQTKESNATNRVDVRYIASIDKLDYKSVGFVLSLNNPIPDYTKDINKSFQVVYKTLIADKERLTAEEVYAEENCSPTHLFAFALEEIPYEKVIYTRAYVELSDGTIVCGDTRTVSIDASGTMTDGDRLNLVTDGATEYVIVRGKEATLTEINAAEELQKYLKMISGAEFPIITDDTQAVEKEIIVGKTKREVAGQFDREELGEDGLIIQTTDEKLWLIGGGERGTIYSVYTFLEEYLGCGFYTKYVEKVPEKSYITLKEIEEDKQIPVFNYRDVAWSDYTDHTREDISVKRKINAAVWGRKLSEKVGEGYTWALDTGGHTFYRLVPSDEYYDVHPEYFAMDEDGNRNKDGQLCLSNPDIPQLIIESARGWLAQDPSIDIISISQNDALNPCLCEECKQIYEEEGGAYSGAILRVVNTVAEDLKKDYPNLIVDTYAYQYSRSAPTKTKPADNVNVRLCAIECCHSHTYAEECDMAYTESYMDGSANVFAKDLEDWSKICDGNLWIYDYNCNFNFNGMTFPDFDILLENYQWYAMHGVTGVMPEGQWASRSYEFGALRSYLISKLLWNPYMSEEEFDTYIDDFMEAVYGPGGKYIREYIELAEELTEDSHFGVDLNTGIYYMYPLEEIENHASGELPTDLTIDMLKNCESVDWTKYWNWYSDVKENPITEEGEKLFKKAMGLAETERQKLDLEKTYLQIENMKSYYYGRQLSVGKETFEQLIGNKIDTASGLDKYTLRFKKTAIINEAYEQCSSAYAEYNRDLCSRMVEWGVIANDVVNLGDFYRFDFTTIPCEWQIDSSIDIADIPIDEVNGNQAKISVEAIDHNTGKLVEIQFAKLEVGAPQYIGAVGYSFDVAVPKGLEGKQYVLTPSYPSYSNVTTTVTVEEDGWLYVLTQGIWGIKEDLKRQGFATMAVYPQGTLSAVHNVVPLVMMGKEVKKGETISYNSTEFGILIGQNYQ